MSELRVPTTLLEAEVVCAGGHRWRGRMYVPSASSRHSGPMHLEEWLSEPQQFLPLRPADGAEPMLVNKQEILWLALERPDWEPESVGETAREVVIECYGERLTGTLYIAMPATQSRVVDFMNGPSAFVTLHHGGRLHVVRKARITRVVELSPPGDDEALPPVPTTES